MLRICTTLAEDMAGNAELRAVSKTAICSALVEDMAGLAEHMAGSMLSICSAQPL